ncbi:MAG: restriction endonuclease subunit S [Oscillospiraceae bacterium]|nr:restriction endonuclease subunit S [Oscillospiraceae bacterium]
MARLGDICTKGSSSIAQKDLEGNHGIYPIYGASGLIKNVDFYQQEQPYVAVVKDGAGVGRVMYLPAKSSVIGTMQYIIPNKGINGKYLAYALEYMNLAKYYTGATIPHIYFKDYCKEELPVHTQDEQENIAESLDKVSELIALRKAQLAKLDQLVKSRFIELFGDVIRNSKSWKMYVFADIASSRLGKMLDAKQQTGKCSYPYLANFNVQWFRFNLDNLNQMDFDEDDRIEFELKDGDLLVCEGGEIGRCAVWHNETQPCFFQKALHRVRCNRQIIHPDYLAWWFKYNCDHDGFAAIAGAKATIAHLPGAKLKQLQVAVPPLELQEQFAVFLKQTDKSKLAIQQSLDKLELLKKSLMQEYFG